MKKAIAADWLIGLLMFGERARNDVEAEAVQSGISWATVRRAADEVGIEKRRQGYGKGSSVHWRLPADHPAVKLAQQMGGQPLSNGNGGR